MLRNERAEFPLAVRFRESGAPVGEVFSFISGLYFRGKLAYAERFAAGGAYVITAGRGLMRPDAIVTHRDLDEIATVPVDENEPRYRDPLERDCRLLGCSEVVLLGSIATGKYYEPLTALYGERLLFPEDFVGRGDMSRGGLMLRAAYSGEELRYIPAMTAIRRGKRPPKLPKFDYARERRL